MRQALGIVILLIAFTGLGIVFPWLFFLYAIIVAWILLDN